MTREEAIKEAYGIPVNKKQHEALQILIPELNVSGDERIRMALCDIVRDMPYMETELRAHGLTVEKTLAYLEKWKEESKAIEAVEKIDKYIDEHLANAHDMKDSNPDKKYYRGWDDALGKMSGILQDVYSGEKQKEQEIDVKDYRLRDTWEYIDEFIKKFRRIPKDIDELSACVDYVINHKSIDEREQKPMENSTRTKIISRAANEKQVVLLSESNGNAEIDWDTRSLEDAKKLLEHGIVFINERLGTKSAEWSEDEKRKQAIIDAIQIVMEECGDAESIEKYKDDIDWFENRFKSLRSQSKQVIKDCPDYNEQKPIFRVGDTIMAKNGTGIPQEMFYIERIEDGFYWEKDNTILISNQDEFQLVEPADNVSKDEYVKKFKALCDAYEIKLPNRTYDIYHLCDDLAELFGNANKQE